MTNPTRGELLDAQGNLIHRFFKTTTEPYDDWDWDGEELLLFWQARVSERYSYDDLCEIIDGFAELKQA